MTALPREGIGAGKASKHDLQGPVGAGDHPVPGALLLRLPYVLHLCLGDLWQCDWVSGSLRQMKAGRLTV